MKIVFNVLVLLMVTAFSIGNKTKCNCGDSNSTSKTIMERIVNGEEVRPHKYPWMVSIMFDVFWTVLHMCGGSIISPRHVLTAAHCFQIPITSFWKIAVGVHNIQTVRETGNGLISINEIIIHEEFDSLNVINDIAIVVTSERIVFGPGVCQICLPKGKLNLDNKKVKAMGWGSSSFFGEMWDVLEEVKQTVVPLAKCNETFEGIVSPTQLCTFKFGTGACNGDSGGPVVWKDPSSCGYTQVGITSYNKFSFCNPTVPWVSTDVSSYVDWIQEKTSDIETEDSEESDEYTPEEYAYIN